MESLEQNVSIDLKLAITYSPSSKGWILEEIHGFTLISSPNFSTGKI